MGGEVDEETESTISIQEYLNEVEEQELEADLVLGGDEGKDCTYAKGYLKRQAIFSCLTCTPDGNAGVCTACSLSCHDGHEIVELWTKRNFRCDCGNSKFGEFFCKLYANKDVENVENSYNHNFKGAYCTCGRPYPDPDLEDQVEMIQCCVCEDWFHEEHIGLPTSEEIPRDDEGEPLYEDFICQECSRACLFLASYPQSIMAAKSSAPSKDKGVLADTTSAPELEKQGVVRMPPDANLEMDRPNIPNGKIFCNGESSAGDLSSSEIKEETIQSSSCILGTNPDLENSMECPRPLFLGKNWRDTLCRCPRCMDMYTGKNISYLLDKDDSIMEYEKMAKQKREEKLQQQEDTEKSLLNNLGHVEKIEILSGIADMKDEIRSFLESFDSSKPITSEDIHQVFENLAKKRRRVQ
ncbi:hypothetical protein MLD38_010842 [Melastoma candidum]|uniref:Uncharacterized protein n=1 Tax=Melastoma candidum TaxID=119954 RepID=A0ACB9R293_9MYRT|nr:hypothetical protein MLD38_010842 [Melastoma candidum]